MPRLTLTISPQAATALGWMVKRGLYGKNKADVAKGLLYDRIRAFYVLEHLPPAPRRRRKPVRDRGRRR